jgi:hypothetical protein
MIEVFIRSSRVTLIFPIMLVLPLYAGEPQWQGASYPATTNQILKIKSQKFQILSTGGSGGGFGKGNVRKNLYDVSFWNSVRGVSSGVMGVYRTDDGGLSWRELASKYPRRPPVGLERTEWVSWNSVWMSGPEEIWLGGVEEAQPEPGKGAVLHSTNGGRTWAEFLKGRLTDVEEIVATSDAVWVLSRFGASFRRFRDGPWKPVSFPSNFEARRMVFPGDVHFDSEYVGYILGQVVRTSVLLKSDDSGRTWSPLQLPSAAKDLTSISFPTSREGWIGGRDVLLHTEDGGDTWTLRTPPAGNQQMNDLIFQRNGVGWAALDQPFDGIGKLIHDYTLFVTRDGGKTWVPVLGGWKDINRLHSLGPGTLWGVGNTPGFVPSDLVVVLTNF